MKLDELRQAMSGSVFYDYQVGRWFGGESKEQVNTQLARWAKGGKLVRLKRGVYAWPEREVDELVVAGVLVKSSYVSLETALSMYGIKPEVSGEVTSVTPVTTRRSQVGAVRYSYARIKRELYFGFERQVDVASGIYYRVARPEKAVLDYLYVRRVGSLVGERLNMKVLDRARLSEWGREYPERVRRLT